MPVRLLDWSESQKINSCCKPPFAKLDLLPTSVAFKTKSTVPASPVVFTCVALVEPAKKEDAPSATAKDKHWGLASIVNVICVVAAKRKFDDV